MPETKHIDIKIETLQALNAAKKDLELESLDETIKYFIRAQETRRGKNWLGKKEEEITI